MPKQNACLEIVNRGCGGAWTKPSDGRTRVAFRTLAARCVMVCVLLGARSASGADWTFGADASLAYDDNLSRASAPADIRADWSGAIAMSATSFAAPGAFDALVVGIRGGAEGFHRYHGLDNASIEATAAYRRKWGMGLEAPWLLLEASAAYYDYDVYLRTGPRFALRAGLGKRFSESLEARIALFGEVRRSPFGEPEVPGISGNVFDLRGHGIDFGGSYALTDDIAVAIDATWRRGDVVSTVSETSQIVGNATAIAEDPTFGEDLYDYRLRGITRSAALTISRALGNRASINLSYAAERTSVGEGLDYRSHRAWLTLLYRY